MAWSWNNNSYGDWAGRPAWHGPNPAPSRGVDRAPDSTREWFGPDPPFTEAFFAGPFGGPRAFGGPGDAPWWPFSRGGHGHGHRGSCGRRAHPERDQAGEGPSRDAQPADADPPTSTPDELNDTTTPGTAVPDEAHQARPPPYHHRPLPHHGPFSRGSPRGPRRGRGGRHPSPGRHHPELPPNPWASTLHSIANTIFPQTPGAAQASDEETPFTPPLDLFAAPSAYILHLALPGAKKSEVGVDWDPDTSTLRVAGVIHRPGDEALLASLLPSSAERRVGYFERLIKLPPPEAAEQARRWRNRRPQGTRVGEKADSADWDEEEGREEVDGAAITAKMEDGVLIITVPKVEKGWTEVSSIDIE